MGYKSTVCENGGIGEALIFLDFRKAFDTLEHECLFKTLMSFNDFIPVVH